MSPPDAPRPEDRGHGPSADPAADWPGGPDPDAPPWARRGEPGDDADDGRDDQAGEAREGDDGAQDADSTGDDDHHDLEVRRGGPPVRPPRRTGVFIDPEDLREHVGGLLRAILGGYEVDAFGNFTFLHDDARVFITVGASPVGPQVGVFSVTNLDLDLSAPLASFLLTTNHTLGFGAFSYDPPNRAVWLRHTLLGTTLDGPELHAAVMAVSTTAAQLDDAIRDRFGGRTFHEAPDDVQRRMEPPEARSEPSAPNASGYL